MHSVLLEQASVCPQQHHRLPAAYCRASVLFTQEMHSQKSWLSSLWAPKLTSLLSVLVSETGCPQCLYRGYIPPAPKSSTNSAKRLTWRELSTKHKVDGCKWSLVFVFLAILTKNAEWFYSSHLGYVFFF